MAMLCLPPAPSIRAFHQQARAPEVGELDAEGRRLRLRSAFDEACAVVPDDVLSRAMRDGAPSAEEAWELQRSATAQLGLHARPAG